MDDDAYYTIARPAQYELKIKGSRFIGECVQVNSVEEATAHLEVIRKREHAATHHCFAYTVGLFEQVTGKYSDDGEPTGTAGKPIDDAIQGRDLSNVIVVVTRYFGGTKLGTGGLARAYAEAASETLDRAGRVERFLTQRFRVVLDFTLYDQTQRLVHKLSARPIDAEFSDRVKLVLEIRRRDAGRLADGLMELGRGRMTIDELDDTEADEYGA